MGEFEACPDGWVVWSAEDDGRVVLTYRPDVFDGDSYPAECLPTLYLTHGRRTRRPGTNPTNPPDDDWHVTLYLEPAVPLDAPERFSDRDAAVNRVIELAHQFDDGEIPYRDVYDQPRPAYLNRLDDLTGQ